jgi:hypothetical protein
MLFFGPLLIARVLLMKDGIWGLVTRTVAVIERPYRADADDTSQRSNDAAGETVLSP